MSGAYSLERNRAICHEADAVMTVEKETGKGTMGRKKNSSSPAPHALIEQKDSGRRRPLTFDWTIMRFIKHFCAC